MLVAGGLRSTAQAGLREGVEDTARAGAEKGAAGHPVEEIPRQPEAPPAPEKPDPLAVAADRSVDVSEIPANAVWRTSDEPLWRFDTRHPDQVFRDGFHPWDPSNTNLEDFVDNNTH